MSNEAIGFDAESPAISQQVIHLGSHSALGEIVKRAIDIFGAACLLLLALPAMAAIALILKLSDHGSVLYKATMVGRRFEEFTILKFRTMTPDADQWLARHPDFAASFLQQMKLPDDPRVTRAGKILRRWSLDELPQLFNVLSGHMSLVGPRPVRPWELSRWGDFASLRQSVLPGLTGLWQVSGRTLIPYEQRAQFDREYIQEWSVWLDLKILLATIPAVITARGAR